jgi:hypothetical protein
VRNELAEPPLTPRRDSRLTREQWRDYGTLLLRQRQKLKSANEFGRWIRERGLDVKPASRAGVRSDAMWLAQHWARLQECDLTNHHPTNVRQECRDAGYAWAFDQR